MAEKNAAGNVTLHQLIDWYRTSIAVAKTDRLAQLPWIFGAYTNGEPIPATHRRIYGMRRDLRTRSPIRSRHNPWPTAMAVRRSLTGSKIEVCWSTRT